MNWTPHTNMIDAINNAIPKGAAQDAGFSTPDIYGRASQLYLSLRKTQGASKQNSDEIRLWRGLLMLVAPSVGSCRSESGRYCKRCSQKSEI